MARKQRVLIVEDSELQAEMLESTLLELGLDEITKVLDAPSALRLFEEAVLASDFYSVVLLDIMMPQMDGQEALKKIRDLEKKHEIPDELRTVIIMTTALNSPSDMIQALTDGSCDDYIVKPVITDLLAKVLMKYGCIEPTPLQ